MLGSSSDQTLPHPPNGYNCFMRQAGWLAGWLAACFLGFLTLQILWVVPAVITLNKTHLETFSHCLCDPAPPRWSSGSWTCPSPQVQSPRNTWVLNQHCGRGSLINRLGDGSNYKLGQHSWCYPTVHRDAFPLTFWPKELLSCYCGATMILKWHFWLTPHFGHFVAM